MSTHPTTPQPLLSVRQLALAFGGVKAIADRHNIRMARKEQAGRACSDARIEIGRVGIARLRKAHEMGLEARLRELEARRRQLAAARPTAPLWDTAGFVRDLEALIDRIADAQPEHEELAALAGEQALGFELEDGGQKVASIPTAHHKHRTRLRVTFGEDKRRPQTGRDQDVSPEFSHHERRIYVVFALKAISNSRSPRGYGLPSGTSTQRKP